MNFTKKKENLSILKNY